MEMTFFKRYIHSISNWIFKALMYTGWREDYPIGSPVMRGMTRYKIFLEIERSLWYSKLFSKLPTLCGYPPIIYPSRYLAFTALSISREEFVVRRAQPILERVLAGGSLFNQLLIMKENFNLHLMASKITYKLYTWDKDFLEYSRLSNYLDMVKADYHWVERIKADCHWVNIAIRMGHSIGYILLPPKLCQFYLFTDIITQDVLQSIKDIIQEWSETREAGDVCDQIKKTIMESVDDTTMRENTSPGTKPHNNAIVVLNRLMIGSLAACILVSLSYISGSDQLQEYLDFNFHNKRTLTQTRTIKSI